MWLNRDLHTEMVLGSIHSLSRGWAMMISLFFPFIFGSPPDHRKGLFLTLLQEMNAPLHQSYCCEIKYSEKQIDLSHGNLYNLAFKLFPRENMAFYTNSTSIDTTSMVQVLSNRKSLDFDYLKSRQMRCCTFKILK